MSRAREMIGRTLGTDMTEIPRAGIPAGAVPELATRRRRSSAVVHFGPYDEQVTFDHYAIFEGDESMNLIPEEGTANSRAGSPGTGNSR
jgi:hypothetical protein